MAKLKNVKTVTEMTNNPRPEHKNMKQSAQSIKFGKMLRAYDQKNSAKKVEMNKETGYPIPNDLREEGEQAYQEMLKRKESREKAKEAGKLRSKAEKAKAREAKKAERKAKRLENK